MTWCAGHSVAWPGILAGITLGLSFASGRSLSCDENNRHFQCGRFSVPQESQGWASGIGWWLTRSRGGALVALMAAEANSLS